MADEKDQKDQNQQTDNKPSFKTADELTTFLTDMQGQMATMQQTIDKLSPVEGNTDQGTDGKDAGKDEKEEKPTDEEVSEIDALLQSE